MGRMVPALPRDHSSDAEGRPVLMGEVRTVPTTPAIAAPAVELPCRCSRRCASSSGAGDPHQWSLDTPAEVLGGARPRNLRRR